MFKCHQGHDSFIYNMMIILMEYAVYQGSLRGMLEFDFDT